jgi:hypothetical protein
MNRIKIGRFNYRICLLLIRKEKIIRQQPPKKSIRDKHKIEVWKKNSRIMKIGFKDMKIGFKDTKGK